MKKKIFGLTMIAFLIFSTIAFISPVIASTTTSVTVTKLANDGTTIIDQVTVTVAQMMSGSAELPIYGDGVTKYYMQGPTFESIDMWNPSETLNVDSRDYGAAKGTDVKDLCELVGGASTGDVINIKASDGFSKNFPYANVYNPAPAQGRIIISWYTKDAGPELSGERYVIGEGNYTTGMRLVFFAETTNTEGKHVFGNYDMQQTLPESYWHYYYDGTTMWPSSSGMSVKYVNEVIIYSQEEPPAPEPSWPLTLVGAHTYTMNQTEFEMGANPSCHGVSYTDASGTWSGIPLWLLVGYVDDSNVGHSGVSFNDAYAAYNYTVRVIAFDGYLRDFNSDFVARNNDIIVANKLNGEELSADRYPLRLIGSALTSGGQRVSQIVRIELIGLPRGEASSSLDATANVGLPTVGIQLDRDNIDYGNIMAGQNSPVETVGITNIGTLACDVTLQVNGVDATAQSFYDQSLYINSNLYNINSIITSIPYTESRNVGTQLKVPSSWTELGNQNAIFILWAEASD
jgi:hypothetical protein